MPKDVPKQPRRKKDTPKDEDRRAVGKAVTERMRQRGLTVAEINRRTGLSETTIYAVIQVTGQPTKSTLALLSAVLNWRIDHLYNILWGRAHENVATESPLEENLAQVVRGLADIDTLREDEPASIKSQVTSATFRVAPPWGRSLSSPSASASQNLIETFSALSLRSWAIRKASLTFSIGSMWLSSGATSIAPLAIIRTAYRNDSSPGSPWAPNFVWAVSRRRKNSSKENG